MHLVFNIKKYFNNILLLDDNTPALIAAAAQSNPTEAVVPEPVKAFDSTVSTVKDSLSNLNLSDVKDIVTGENTIIRDGLSALTKLTVEFVGRETRGCRCRAAARGLFSGWPP
ncbi:MAG: hypothetical protein J6X59_00160 [Bacteroidales bacterium]|nr:hypothetical protein [Bacteroidales bacterium]